MERTKQVQKVIEISVNVKDRLNDPKAICKYPIERIEMVEHDGGHYAIIRISDESAVSIDMDIIEKIRKMKNGK